MTQAEHWERIYRTRDPTTVSWYQPEPTIDVGGGASTLVDGLLAAGYRHLTVLDLSPTALVLARQRLGAKAGLLTWIAGSILDVQLEVSAYAVWHDRAVFHFLTDHRDRARYIAQTRQGVRAGGHVIVASFGPDGPARCSGLDVARYSADDMYAEFGDGFRLLDRLREAHHTPTGAVQAFVYCLCRVES